MTAQLTPHAANETATLRTVVLGLPDSPGATPSLEEAYDATSYRSVELGIYPQEKDIKREMDALLSVLERMYSYIMIIYSSVPVGRMNLIDIRPHVPIVPA